MFVSAAEIDRLNAILLELHPDDIPAGERFGTLRAVALLCGYRPAEPWEVQRHFAHQHVGHEVQIYADENGDFVAAYTPLVWWDEYHGLARGRFESARQYQTETKAPVSRLEQLIGALRAGE